MKKPLVLCPNCKAQGITSFLGEIDSQGDFLIERIHRRKGGVIFRKKTRVRGSDFTVFCNECGEPSYIRKEVTNGQRARPYNGIQWIHRESTVGTYVGSVSG